jgi:hypothetical protein
MDEYEIARKRVKTRQGFYIHFAVFLLISGLFFIINASSGGYPWFIIPTLGWGIGVVHHALNAFSRWEGPKRGFLHHFATFAMVSLLLLFINASTGGPPWFLFPVLGWGVGIAAHFFRAFYSTGSDWEKRQVEKEMRRLQRAPREEDDRLELREPERQKEPEKRYREDDLV